MFFKNLGIMEYGGNTMSYVIYDINTTIIKAGIGASRRRYAGDRGCDEYKTITAAKSAMSREKRLHPAHDISNLAIAEKTEFCKAIEKTRIVFSIMDQNHEHPIVQPVNTPSCCSPDSETYWSM